MTLAARVPARATTRLKKERERRKSRPDFLLSGSMDLDYKKMGEKRGEISSFQVIHEALSKLYPMIYHTDVLADLESSAEILTKLEI